MKRPVFESESVLYLLIKFKITARRKRLTIKIGSENLLEISVFI